MPLLLLISDLYLVGVGLTVALVVYPSFHLVGAGQWIQFHRAHVRRITYVVGVAWVAQGVGSLWWLLRGPDRGVGEIHAVVALAAVVLTLVKAVPIHQRLERHCDSHDIRQLQRWHLWRTLAWTICALTTLRLI